MTVNSPITIRPALPVDHALVAGLLRANDLPLDGVPRSMDAFLVAEQDGALVGAIGLECYGTDALLRSAVVDASVRSIGLGALLVDGIIAQAATRGIGTLWLRTTTAAQWFPRFGFSVVTREDVPQAVRASREFEGACPSSAMVMRRVR